MTPGPSNFSGPLQLGKVYFPDHPIMKNVKVFNGGSLSYRVSGKLQQKAKGKDYQIITTNYSNSFCS